MSNDVYETLALSLTILVSVLGIVGIWWKAPAKRKKWLRKAKSGLILAFLWVRGKQNSRR